MSGVAEVLVQVFGENVHILLFESLVQVNDELDLRGRGSLWAGHHNTVIDGELLWVGR